MKKYLSLVTLIVLMAMSINATAQQRPQFTQSLQHTFLDNPAVTGAYDYFDVRLGYRNQWTGFENAPQSVFLTGHVPLNRAGNSSSFVGYPLPTLGSNSYDPHLNTKKDEDEKKKSGGKIRHGLGGTVLHDKTGPNQRLMASLSYAAHLPIGEKFRLSLGLQGGIINYSQNFSELDSKNNTVSDNALYTDNQSALAPDLGAGIFFYSDRFYIGMGAAQLLDAKISYTDTDKNNNKLKKHFYGQIGYRINGNSVSFVPYTRIKILEASPMSVDFGIRSFLAQDRLMLGVGYRGIRFNGGDEKNGIDETLFKEDAAFGMIGFNITPVIDLHYSFDYSFSDLTDSKYGKSAAGSHEITIGIKLKNKTNQQRLF